MRQKLFLIAFIGVVGSGKTYIASILARKLKALHIRTDSIRIFLRKKGKTYSSAPQLAKALAKSAFSKNRSVVFDFDAVNPKRQLELRQFAKKFGAKIFFIRVNTTEKIIIKRLREHRYTKNDFFKNAKEAVGVYFLRKKLHSRKLRRAHDFVINNAHPLEPQINKIVKRLRD
ncbi:MAG: AAA family ATPase [bacterium]|nr:AAA family ATPase [bacterium]